MCQVLQLVSSNRNRNHLMFKLHVSKDQCIITQVKQLNTTHALAAPHDTSGQVAETLHCSKQVRHKVIGREKAAPSLVATTWPWR